MRRWRKLDGKYLLRDRWLTVRADRCELPNGLVIDPYYVLEENEWVHVFALHADNRLLLVRQYRYAANTVCTELPGGAVEDGEEPLDAAMRELKEETGYLARNWTKLGVLFANPGRQTNRVHTFLARDLVQDSAQRLDATEDIAISFADIESVNGMISSGEFSQSLHVASFFLGCQAASGVLAPVQTAMHPTDSFEFRRRIDGVAYRFEPATPREGRPAWKRADLDLWLAWMPAQGWCVVDAQGTATSKPWRVEVADPCGEPPEGEWVSKKGDKSYVYDLVRVPVNA